MAVMWLMVTWGTHTGSRYQRLPVVSGTFLGNFSGSRNDDFKVEQPRDEPTESLPGLWPGSRSVVHANGGHAGFLLLTARLGKEDSAVSGDLGSSIFLPPQFRGGLRHPAIPFFHLNLFIGKTNGDIH